ncbi:MAG: NitT/TauT family transport system substrate-binding protein [Clostridia bacterium]|nr:NitT/TauT family transport system substrate-binding protein [Clostridia bacterium]
MRIWKLTLIFALALILLGCNTKNNSEIKIGVIPVEDNFPFFVADAEGMFHKAGLKVELVPFNSARDRDLALQAGNIDGAVADIVASGLLRKAGVPVKIVCLTMGTTPAEGRFALLAKPGWKPQSIRDLKGKKVALSENTIIEYVTDRLLQEAGLEPEEVEKIPVPQIPERLHLLLAGKVEAALLPDPLASLAEKQGARTLLDDTKLKRNISQVVLVMSERTLSKYPQETKKLIQVYGEAARVVTAQPEKYRRLFIEKARLPQELQDTYLTPKFAPPRLPRPEEVSDVIEWMLKKGLITKPFSYTDLVSADFLPAGGREQ